MGCFIAKLKGEDDRWYKLVDQEGNEDYEGINLTDAIEYDPNNTEAGQWFYVPKFNEKEGFLPLLDKRQWIGSLSGLAGRDGRRDPRLCFPAHRR